MTSRWAHWSSGTEEKRGFSSFLKEGAAQDEAEKLGLKLSGFGWYSDPKTGKRVAKIVGDKLVQYNQDQQGTGGEGTTAATTDTGNPTGPGYQSPGQKAKSMGLQSDGSGGYIDPSTGQLAARTVNNELVFYSDNGGAVSDGSGGEQLTQPSPSWVDPVTGELMVPPAQPESPEELAAVPNSVPSQAPASYNGFMNARRKEMYASNAAQDSAAMDIENQQKDVDEVFGMHPGMGELQRQMQGVIQRANDSGDEKKRDLAGRAQQMLETEAGKMLKYFAFAPEEKQQDIINMLRTLMIAKSKMQSLDDKSDNRPAALNDEDYEEYKDSREKTNYNQNALDDMHDEHLEVPDAPKMKEGKDYPREVEGDLISYDLKPYKIGKTSYSTTHAQKAARDNNVPMRNFSDAAVVSWDVKDSDENFDADGNKENMDPRERKKAAIEALQVWRKEVLPSLTPGLVLIADPMETDKDMDDGRSKGQRMRMYQLAGFGGRMTDGVLGALVTQDENGENKLVPLNPDDDQKQKLQIESRYLQMLNYNLNNDEKEVIFEMLFT